MTEPKPNYTNQLYERLATADGALEKIADLLGLDPISASNEAIIAHVNGLKTAVDELMAERDSWNDRMVKNSLAHYQKYDMLKADHDALKVQLKLWRDKANSAASSDLYWHKQYNAARNHLERIADLSQGDRPPEDALEFVKGLVAERDELTRENTTLTRIRDTIAAERDYGKTGQQMAQREAEEARSGLAAKTISRDYWRNLANDLQEQLHAAQRARPPRSDVEAERDKYRSAIFEIREIVAVYNVMSVAHFGMRDIQKTLKKLDQ